MFRRHEYVGIRSVEFVLFGFLSVASLIAQTEVVPPTAPQVEHREVRHGETVVDDYYWIREKSNPEVIKYLTSLLK